MALNACTFQTVPTLQRSRNKVLRCHQRSTRCSDVLLPTSEHLPSPSSAGRLLGAAFAAVAASCVLTGGTQPAVALEVQTAQPTHHAQPMADVALAGLFGEIEERDPIGAFTLYGTTFKKFAIEKLQGEKIVSRARGFTVDTCVGSAAAEQETPSFQFLPTGEKVQATGNAVCEQATGSDLEQTCKSSCESACSRALAKWEQAEEERSGFTLLEKDRTRLLRTCSRECSTDCTRPGRAFDFVVPYRK